LTTEIQNTALKYIRRIDLHITSRCLKYKLLIKNKLSNDKDNTKSICDLIEFSYKRINQILLILQNWNIYKIDCSYEVGYKSELIHD